MLDNGYVRGRGKAYAEGAAYAGLWKPAGGYKPTTKPTNKTSNTATKTSNNNNNKNNKTNTKTKTDSKETKDATEEFKETFDWFEMLLEEINSQIDIMNQKLENTASITSKNNIIDQMIDLNKSKLSDLKKGLDLYKGYANGLLKEIPAKYREMAKDGAIAISDFEGEADESVVEAISKYREWAQKINDVTLQIEEQKAAIAELAKQKFDNISESYDNKTGLKDAANEKLEAQVSYMESTGTIASPQYYQEMAKNTSANISYLEQEKAKLQKTLDKEVEAGHIDVGDDDWYEMVQELYAVDTAIIEAKTDLDGYQMSINDISWDRFDEFIQEFQILSTETQDLIDLMGRYDMVTDNGEWTKEGTATLGLYAQQMEIAEYQSHKYDNKIKELNEDYANGLYSLGDYMDKLTELKDGQRDSIEQYNGARDAIIELNKTRIDAIKKGIEKEIDAYDKLIQKKKEELDTEKDLYDFQKSTAEQQKNISDINRQIAALAGDTSSSAAAKRKQLQAELAEAKAGLEDSYYNRSIDNQKNALDKEQEAFNQQKDADMAKLDEYLEKEKKVISDSFDHVKANADEVYKTITAEADKYGMELLDATITPWEQGEDAIGDYSHTFKTSMNETLEVLREFKEGYLEEIEEIEKNSKIEIDVQKEQNKEYVAAKKDDGKGKKDDNKDNKNDNKNNNNNNKNNKSDKPAQTPKTIKVGGQVNAGSAKIYPYVGAKSGGKQYYASNPVYTVLGINGDWVKVRHKSLKSGTSGWFKKGDVKALAVGTKSLEKSGIVNVDELGEELILGAKNGRLTYLEKGSGVVPADLTSNLMQWGEMNPQEMIDRNRPSIAPSKNVINTEVQLDCSVGTLVNIEHCDKDVLPDVEKMVNKALDKHMQNLNNSLKRYAR